MTELTLTGFILAIIIGTLLAIVYSLRILVMLERRIANIEEHLERMTRHILRDESDIKKALKSRR